MRYEEWEDRPKADSGVGALTAEEAMARALGFSSAENSGDGGWSGAGFRKR